MQDSTLNSWVEFQIKTLNDWPCSRTFSFEYTRMQQSQYMIIYSYVRHYELNPTIYVDVSMHTCLVVSVNVYGSPSHVLAGRWEGNVCTGLCFKVSSPHAWWRKWEAVSVCLHVCTVFSVHHRVHSLMHALLLIYFHLTLLPYTHRDRIRQDSRAFVFWPPCTGRSWIRLKPPAKGLVRGWV